MIQDQIKQLQVCSEVGPLKKVMLHRPGRELERILPEQLSELLFEDIPWLSRMQKEHDGFARELKESGVEIFYVEDLLQDVLHDEVRRRKVLEDVLEGSDTCDKPAKDFLYEYLQEKSAGEFVDYMIGGINKEDIKEFKKVKSLSDFVEDPHYFYINPLPNLYFMRDPAVVIGDGIAIGSMHSPVRKRESGFMRLLYEHHPLFARGEMDLYFSNDFQHTLEGGDVLVLSKDTLAVGCSQRTGVAGIELLADQLFSSHSDIRNLLIIQIPKVRAYMHLDTVFTMIDYDKFTIYSGILDAVNVFSVTKTESGAFDYAQEENLQKALEKYLKTSLELIPSGGDDPVTAAREQWNDGTNTLAIAPGKVVAYGRNEVSNRVLRSRGINVIEIEASELVRGRGGPRCMSMPLHRTDQ
ncbi:arginine deiminase [Alkalibacter rhizosphaerae]|uniref:Arginine deiminase n=1 Tax=Alkalibacter rhizosphaerae TaxID=2815577 RepID=A0A975AH87_9FIRM|nr:arginine deiminase [Alkalibacter rhizosphaerae]QSX07748.1 arginine deiminase [Alkalibacter rhizosphaerae]